MQGGLFPANPCEMTDEDCGLYSTDLFVSQNRQIFSGGRNVPPEKDISQNI